MRYRYTVIIGQDEDGDYIAEVPALQGCYSQGKSYEEALTNIQDAIRLHIEARKQLGEDVPIERAVEEVEIYEPTASS